MAARIDIIKLVAGRVLLGTAVFRGSGGQGPKYVKAFENRSGQEIDSIRLGVEDLAVVMISQAAARAGMDGWQLALLRGL